MNVETPASSVASAEEDSSPGHGGATAAAPPDGSHRHHRRYRGGFTTSICDIFRDPHRRTDCCAVACCGVLSSDRSRYLLTGERPPPLWCRVLLYLLVPALLIAAMNYFSVEVPADSSGGNPDDGEDKEGGAVKVISPGLFWAFVLYVIGLITYGFMKNQATRRDILTKLYEERARERGEEVDPAQLQLFLSRQNLDTVRAHCCWSFCYRHDYEFFDETAGMVIRDGPEDEEEPEEDFCTRLWACLAGTFWCCGCWCQCCGCCALAQEEREVNRLTGNEEQTIDYLTFQPYSEYYPSIESLRESRDSSPWKHYKAISDLSSNLLKNVAAVLVILILFALSDINSNFTWENMIVLLLTLGQAFFIEWLVHWRWNLFDLSFDSVIKYFACGFLLTTPMAVIFEMIVSTLGSVLMFVLATIIIASDSQLANDLASDPKKGMEEIFVNFPALFVFMEFVNAFLVAALVEEMVKYFGYRMVVTPDLLPKGRYTPTTGNSTGSTSESRVKSTGSGVTVAMVSVALGFACCENLMYVFVYAPPTLGVQISTLVARSLFPVHPLCAAIQSIGVCKRDLEGDKRFGVGRIIFPAILLHGSFDFVLMVSAYFQQRKTIAEKGDDDANADDEAASESLGDQLPALITGLALVISAYIYYVIQSRAQKQRLIAIDTAATEQTSSLV